MSRDGVPSRESPGDEYASAVERLYSEFDTDAPTGTETPVSRTVEGAIEALFDTDEFEFEETYVKASLDELLLSIISLRSSDTHGKQLLDDLAGDFDTALSPGTVYPRLHDLCEEGVLEQRELVKTKEYTLDDVADAESSIAEAARHHLALGMVFRSAIEHGEFD